MHTDDSLVELMAQYLVEEVYGTDLGGIEKMLYRVVVEATSFTDALDEARRLTRYTFHYGPDELVELVPDVLWSAGDGSMVAVDIRQLPVNVSRRASQRDARHTP